MRRATTLLLFGVLLNSVAAKDDDNSDDEPDEDYIIKLNPDNWDKTMEKHERVLVEFIIPGDGDHCVGCRELRKDFGKTSKMLKAEQLDSQVALVDCANETTGGPELAKRWNVTKYPTIKYFVKGKYNKDFDGKKSFDGLVLWMKNKEDPPVKEYTEEEAQKFIDEIEDDEFALVAYLKKKSARWKMYKTAVEDTMREWDKAKFKFGVVWLGKDADPKKDAKLMMHRPGVGVPDPEEVWYDGSIWSEEKLLWWMKNGTYPTLGKKFTRNVYAPMSMDEMGWEGAMVGMIDDNTITEGEEQKDEPIRGKVEEAMRPFALQNPQWKFVIAEIERLEDHELELLNVKYGDEPRLIMLGTNRKKYHLIGEDEILDEDRVDKWIADVKAKRIKPTMKSQPKPEDEYDEDGNMIIVGKTFDELVVEQEDKDIVVFFYAPWCKHCDKMKPEWKALNEKAEKAGWKDKGVIVAKFDAGNNECEEEVPSYPRVALYPAVKSEKKLKERTIYAGKRNSQALFDFVEQSAKNLGDEDEEEEDDAPKKKRRKRKSGKKEEL